MPDRKRVDTTVRLTITAADYGRERLTPLADAIVGLLGLDKHEVLEVRIELDLLEYLDLHYHQEP